MTTPSDDDANSEEASAFHFLDIAYGNSCRAAEFIPSKHRPPGEEGTRRMHIQIFVWSTCIDCSEEKRK